MGEGLPREAGATEGTLEWPGADRASQRPALLWDPSSLATFLVTVSGLSLKVATLGDPPPNNCGVGEAPLSTRSSGLWTPRLGARPPPPFRDGGTWGLQEHLDHLVMWRPPGSISCPCLGSNLNGAPGPAFRVLQPEPISSGGK